MAKKKNTKIDLIINPKTQKEFSSAIKTLNENNSKIKNQYSTLFRELRKMKGRIGFLESESFKLKQENEKYSTHFDDELFAMQSTLDFFTCDVGDEKNITTVEEKKEEKEKLNKKQQKEIMGVSFSDKVLIPEKTKTK